MSGAWKQGLDATIGNKRRLRLRNHLSKLQIAKQWERNNPRFNPRSPGFYTHKLPISFGKVRGCRDCRRNLGELERYMGTCRGSERAASPWRGCRASIRLAIFLLELKYKARYVFIFVLCLRGTLIDTSLSRLHDAIIGSLNSWLSLAHQLYDTEHIASDVANCHCPHPSIQPNCEAAR